MRPGERGFTLIEVLVVLAVLGLVAGLIVFRGPQRNATLDLRQATAMVTGGLRAARARAIATNRPVPVRVGADGAALQVGDEAARRVPPGVRVASGPLTILFRPDGSSSGGALELAAGDRRETVAVNWLTGRVTKAP